jgi:hypothetical protein
MRASVTAAIPDTQARTFSDSELTGESNLPTYDTNLPSSVAATGQLSPDQSRPRSLSDPMISKALEAHTTTRKAVNVPQADAVDKDGPSASLPQDGAQPSRVLSSSDPRCEDGRQAPTDRLNEQRFMVVRDAEVHLATRQQSALEDHDRRGKNGDTDPPSSDEHEPVDIRSRGKMIHPANWGRLANDPDFDVEAQRAELVKG